MGEGARFSKIWKQDGTKPVEENVTYITEQLHGIQIKLM